MNQILIDQGDNNKTFESRVGDMITITVKENPTTGYRWKSQIDEEIILMEDSKYLIDPSSRIGGGGARTFTFRVRSPGKTKIHLNLNREWEKEKNPIDQLVVFIQAGGSS
jgi:inhibitor of cysteine peptidase